MQKLNKVRLDKSAIEAEAIRRCSAELERIERLLASRDMCRTRALDNIRVYRESLAHELEEELNRIVERQNVHRLRPPAA